MTDAPHRPLPPLVRLPRLGVAAAHRAEGERVLAEEVPVALSYDGVAHAVMMASPFDLEDFGIGFTLTEGIAYGLEEITGIEVVGRGALGCELRLRLAEGSGDRHLRRRRMLAGPLGCGLCGLESLAEATRAPPRVGDGPRLRPEDIACAVAAMEAAQAMNRVARALHAAAYWRPGDGLVAVREDVGRHNALDKLAGALARRGEGMADGALLLTSRISVDLVQKAAQRGATVLVAVSAPTALAVRTAEACGVTLVGVVRGDAFEVFTGRERVLAAC